MIFGNIFGNLGQYLTNLFKSPVIDVIFAVIIAVIFLFKTQIVSIFKGFSFKKKENWFDSRAEAPQINSFEPSNWINRK